MANLCYRYFYRQGPRLGIYKAYIDGLQPGAYVTVSASEARSDVEFPGRFIGGARPILIGSVAAHRGYVEFSPWWTRLDVSYLDLWVDIVVLQS